MSALARLHAVTNDAVLQQPDFLARALKLLEMYGADVALHLRARAASARLLYHLAVPLRAAGTLIVNDRVDLALAAQAMGVHLRGDSLSIAQARALLGPEALVGRSVHSLSEAQAAEQEGANYLLLGTIFESRSHPGQAPLGVEMLRKTVRSVAIPVIAIGGIDPIRAATCLEAGSYGVGAVGAVWDAYHPPLRAAWPVLT